MLRCYYRNRILPDIPLNVMITCALFPLGLPLLSITLRELELEVRVLLLIPIFVHKVALVVLRTIKLPRIPQLLLECWDELILTRFYRYLFRRIYPIHILKHFESEFQELIIKWIEFRVCHLKHELLGVYLDFSDIFKR